MSVRCYAFFFQAEDGIRYLVRSRGLGDVYKRQAERRREGIGDDAFTRDKDHLAADGWELVFQQDADGLRVRFVLMVRQEDDVFAGGQLRRHALHHLAPGEGRSALVHQRPQELDAKRVVCLLYTSDAAHERTRVDLGGRRCI